MVELEDLELLALVKKRLLALPYANETPSMEHVRLRCPICGDSTHRTDSTRCYVNIEYGKPMTFYCFKCNEGGLVSSRFLNYIPETGLLQLASAITKYNRQFFRNDVSGYVRSNRSGIVHIQNSFLPDMKLTKKEQRKVDYIYGRLGLPKYEYESFVRKLKIVPSIKKFLEFNGRNLNPRFNRFARQLEEHYVGFLSMDGSSITFRDTRTIDKESSEKSGNPRHVIYPVIQHPDATKGYIIPNDVDIMNDTIDFYMAEGTMDCISCFLNVHNGKMDNSTIYGAVNGSGYRNLIHRILSMGFIGNLRIHCYSDKDKPIGYYDSLSTIKDAVSDIDIWYNDYPKEKDIGVPSDRIQLVRSKRDF